MKTPPTNLVASILAGRMGNVRLSVQIDFGVGDVVVPAPRVIESKCCQWSAISASYAVSFFSEGLK